MTHSNGQVKTSTCIPILLTRMMLINLKSLPKFLSWKERLERRVCKLFTGLHGHLTPHLSNCEPVQLVLVDKKIKFCQPTLCSQTIMLLYFGLSLLLFPLMSVCFCTLSSTHLDWISQSLRQNTLKQENPVLPLYWPPVWALPPHCTSADALAAEQLHVIRQTVVLSATTLPEKAVKYFSRTKRRKYFTLNSIQRNLSLIPYYYLGKTPCYMTCCLMH